MSELLDRFQRLSCNDLFPQFSRLPPELRRLIWQHTWEHRVVTLARKLEGWTEGHLALGYVDWSIPYVESLALWTRAANARRIRSQYGVPVPPPTIHDWLFSGPSFRTKTWSDAPLPVSLSVNRESRHETQLHFRVALGMERGHSRVYFNFDLDTLRLPLHTPLAMCFGREDLALLTRITVPELAPMLSPFARVTGPWDEVMLRPSAKDVKKAPRPEASGALHDEFRLVWTYLRRWFPNVREIGLERHDACNRWGTSGWRRSNLPHAENNRISISPQEMDRHCHSCRNLAKGIMRRFHRIGRIWGELPWVEYVLDHYNIVGAVWRQDRVSIGTVRVPPRAGGRVYEDVVVTFWTTRKSGGVKREPDLRLRCVARSLERFFGISSSYDYPVYSI